MIACLIFALGLLLILLGAVVYYNAKGGAQHLVGTFFFLIALICIAFSAWPAFGHDHNRPGLNSWYGTLASGKGPCCGGPSVDAKTLDGPDWETKDGHYRVRIDGVWHDVEDEAVLKQPNIDGRTLVWPIGGWGGVTIRCFMPGAGG